LARGIDERDRENTTILVSGFAEHAEKEELEAYFIDVSIRSGKAYSSVVTSVRSLWSPEPQSRSLSSNFALPMLSREHSKKMARS